MKILLTIAICITLASCSSKKTEVSSTVDSLAVDSAAIATEPAPSNLAFDPIAGFSVKNTVALEDTVNFILLTSQEELDNNFVVDKTTVNPISKPDFVINYIIGIVCLPSQLETSIKLDKVEATADFINVYVNIQRGEKKSLASKASGIFAIERRDAANIQFYVNGKKDKSFFMTGM